MIKAVLLDISGVLHVDGQPVAGAVDALAQLQQTGLAIRFVTNTSRSTSQQTLQQLQSLGFAARAEQVFTAPAALKQVLEQRQLRPFCLIHPQLEAEFADLPQNEPNAVVVADAAELFSYANLNQAFQLLMAGAPLLAIGRNRYFKSAGQLQLDAGPFIRALEYASEVEAEVFGKPAAGFFQAAVSSVGCQPEQVLMIGDDAEADVAGAMNAGLQACLVQTGKYLSGDEQKIQMPGAQLSASVVEALKTVC